jgi:hypothetical protein
MKSVETDFGSHTNFGILDRQPTFGSVAEDCLLDQRSALHTTSEL